MSISSSPAHTLPSQRGPARRGRKAAVPRWACTVLAAAVLQLLALPAEAGNVVFRATEVPTLMGAGADETSTATAINNAGQIVGVAVDALSGEQRSFLLTNGQVTRLWTGNSNGYASATALSDQVGLLGVVYAAGTQGRLGAVQTYASAIGQLSTVTNIVAGFGQVTQVAGVNTSGQIVGTVLNPNNRRQGDRLFVRDSQGQITTLIAGFDEGTLAVAINNAGRIAGNVLNRVGSITSAGMWNDGVYTRLGTGSVNSFAHGLGSNGWVVGEAQIVAGDELHAVVFRDGRMDRLAANLEGAGQRSAASAVNASGQIVGRFSQANSGLPSFFIDTPWTGSVDISPLIVGQAANRPLIGISGINDLGQMVGSTATRGVLLSPEGTLSWAKLAGGVAGDPANWDSGLGFAPNRLLDVVVNSRASQTVRVEADLQAKSLQVGAALTDAMGGLVTLQLANGAVIQPGSGLTVLATGTLLGDGRVAGNVINRGTVLSLADQRLRIDGNLDNHGLVTGHGRIDANLINRGDSLGVQVGAGQVLTLAGSGHTNGDGSVMRVSDGGTLRLVGSLVNQAGAVVQLNRGTLRLDNGLTNGGQLQVSFGGADILGDVVNGPNGKIIASGGSQTTFWNMVVNDGEARAGAGARIVYFGEVRGNGSFVTEGAGAYHRFEGGFKPGHSPAAVTLGHAQFASTLVMEIGGLQAGAAHDQLRFDGSVLFDAGSVLDVDLLGSWQPQAGDSYQLFMFSQAPVGRFADLLLPTLAGGLQWDSSRLYSDGVLGVAMVPEPQTWALWALGLVGVVGRRYAAQARPSGGAAGAAGDAAPPAG